MEQFESIKSKERVKELGEVFTPKEIVEDMLGLVDKASIEDMSDNANGYRGYSYDLDKTFLEPSCGTGNFLVQIVARKCETAISNYAKHKNITLFELDLLRAVATVYGVDIMSDNVRKSRERVIETIHTAYTSETKHEVDEQLKDVIEYIVDRNIVFGNTLENKMYFRFPTRRGRKMEPAKTNMEGTITFSNENCIVDVIRDLEFSTWEFKGENVIRTSYSIRSSNSIEPEEAKDNYESIHYRSLHKLLDIKEKDQSC